MHTIYRMTIVRAGNVPATGGALLVSNTVSYVDHVIIFAALRRPVRLFMGREFYEHPLINPIARAIKAIPVSSADSPKAIAQALNEARGAIQNGELVCIFAERDVTRIGNMLSFGRGLEFIMRDLDAPIIPMHLDRIWGSTFSFVDGKLSWRLPKVIPYPVTVTFGTPMSATARAHEVRLAVQELSAEAFALRGKSQRKLHVSFIYEAKRHPFRFCMADSLGTELSRIKTLTAMLVLASKLFPGKREDTAGEKIGILMPTTCAAVLANGAVTFAGRIPVNLNFTSSRKTVQDCIRQCGMRTILTSRTFLEKANIAPFEGMVFLEDVKASISKRTQLGYFLALLLMPAWLIARLFVRGDRTSIGDLACIKFSSGSTGEPKGVMLTHQNISSNIESAYQVFNIKSSDILMGVLPFFHSFGFTVMLWLPLTSGTGVVFHPNPFDAATIGDMVKKYKATILVGTPTMLANYARKCTKEQFASLRFVVAGAEKLKESIAEIFYEKFGIPPFEGYGCTELSPIVSTGISSFIDPKGAFVQVGNKPGTVGHPILGVAAKIVHPETFEMMPSGESGLLLIKGPNVMKGYLNNPGLTREVIRGGWYVTGDIAALDEDGFIAITDRLSRFSKIGGEMVPHIKIEEEIHAALGEACPACVVTAVADERKGERLVVLYQGDLDVDAVYGKLRESGLPNLWLPKKENFFRVEEIPLLGTGKVDLKKVKDLAEKYSA